MGRHLKQLGGAKRQLGGPRGNSEGSGGSWEGLGREGAEMIMKIKQEGLKGPQIQLELYLGLLETISLHFHYHFRPFSLGPPSCLSTGFTDN